MAFALFFGPAWAQRTELKPGWNLFSPEQDVEIGRQVSTEAEKQMQSLNDSRVDAYLSQLARRLAEKAPGVKYSYQVKAVNDLTINAFALPGGFLYFNRGVIEAAQNEAQIAGVVGHEIGHVALRHGTNQASKASLAQGGLALLGGLLGADSIAGIATNLAAGFGANSILLKYSRDAERQADLAGTYMLYDNRYDPRAMVQFFEILEEKSGGRSRLPQWLSTHPNPGDRMQMITKEIERLGETPQSYRADTAEFREMQRYIKTLPAPKEKPKQQGQSGQKPSDTSTQSVRPEPPSARLLRYENKFLQIRYPRNWKVSEQDQTVNLAPENGWFSDSQGKNSLAYGIILSIAEQQKPIQNMQDLEQSAAQLIRSMQQNNPRMRTIKSGEPIRAGRERAWATLLTNESPVGGNETVWLVTLAARSGLLYLVCVAPEKEFDLYFPAFRNVADSLALR